VSYLIVRKKNSSTVPKVMALYGILCFCFLYFYYDIPIKLTQNLQTAYTFFEYAVFTYIFWVNFKNKKIKNVVILISILFFCFQLLYLLSGKVKNLDSVPIGIETIIQLFFIFHFFYQFSKDLSTAYIYNHYGFWISVGILIYLGGSFFFFILFDHLTKAQVTTFGKLTYVAEIIKNLLFALAIFIQTKYPFQNKKQKTESIPYLDLI
jgi:hypothetical protein